MNDRLVECDDEDDEGGCFLIDFHYMKVQWEPIFLDQQHQEHLLKPKLDIDVLEMV